MQVRCNQGRIALFVWNSKKFLHCFLWTGSVSDKGGWGATVKRSGVFGWQWAKRETAACPGSSIRCSINSSTANSLREEIIHRYLIFLDHIWSMVPWTAWVLQYKKDLDQLECHQGTGGWRWGTWDLGRLCNGQLWKESVCLYWQDDSLGW